MGKGGDHTPNNASAPRNAKPDDAGPDPVPGLPERSAATGPRGQGAHQLADHLERLSKHRFGKGADSEAPAVGFSLRPLADQLTRIAEQLRAGDLYRDGSVADDQAEGREATPEGSSNTRRGIDQADASQASPAAKARSEAETASGPIDRRRSCYAKLAATQYATRRRRTEIFGNVELFGEPAWDILLDLYIAHAKDIAVSVSSACIGSASPPTTGLRWLGVLADKELILREHDPNDQRRVLVKLSEKGLCAMDRYFAACSIGSELQPEDFPQEFTPARIRSADD